jgi:hypothetical protein
MYALNEALKNSALGVWPYDFFLLTKKKKRAVFNIGSSGFVGNLDS